MSIGTLINRECALIRRTPGAIDDYGNATLTETSTATVCELQQVQSDEQDDAGEVARSTFSLFLLPDETIGTEDAVVVDGVTYEMVGAPWLARNPRTGEDSHIEARVRVVAP